MDPLGGARVFLHRPVRNPAAIPNCRTKLIVFLRRSDSEAAQNPNQRDRHHVDPFQNVHAGKRHNHSGNLRAQFPQTTARDGQSNHILIGSDRFTETKSLQSIARRSTNTIWNPASRNDISNT